VTRAGCGLPGRVADSVAARHRPWPVVPAAHELRSVEWRAGRRPGGRSHLPVRTGAALTEAMGGSWTAMRPLAGGLTVRLDTRPAPGSAISDAGSGQESWPDGEPTARGLMSVSLRHGLGERPPVRTGGLPTAPAGGPARHLHGAQLVPGRHPRAMVDDVHGDRCRTRQVDRNRPRSPEPHHQRFSVPRRRFLTLQTFHGDGQRS